jgi:hypothetical protein
MYNFPCMSVLQSQQYQTAMAGLLAGNNITGRLRHYRQAATAAKC